MREMIGDVIIDAGMMLLLAGLCATAVLMLLCATAVELIFRRKPPPLEGTGAARREVVRRWAFGGGRIRITTAPNAKRFRRAGNYHAMREDIRQGQAGVPFLLMCSLGLIFAVIKLLGE